MRYDKSDLLKETVKGIPAAAKKLFWDWTPVAKHNKRYDKKMRKRVDEYKKTESGRKYLEKNKKIFKRYQ